VDVLPYLTTSDLTDCGWVETMLCGNVFQSTFGAPDLTHQVRSEFLFPVAEPAPLVCILHVLLPGTFY
jgi:hypothetical protein